MTRVLGISASLRNARFGIERDTLTYELRSLATREDLIEYLRKHTQFRLDDFVESGRAQGLSFDKIYSRLRKLREERGLSNSEAALAAALWGAQKAGSAIHHVSLAHYFPATGKGRDLDDLRMQIEAADAIILSGPVYFGDRGSLAQSLIEFIAADKSLRASCRGKIYAGVTVGAKRNGGQETTLIYQMLDMINLDFLAVGNSSETTTQYGGTVVAGDVGKTHTDAYGIETSIGTGQRVAQAAGMLSRARASNTNLRDPLKLHLWLLQDDENRSGLVVFNDWARQMSEAHRDLEIRIFDIAASEVVRCIACDICPTHVGAREEYRCIITAGNDFFVQNHAALIGADAVLLCAYSPENRSSIRSMYQQFIERTRYLRRDNYALADLLVAPFVISELNARQNLHLRMLTSIMRHNTILHHPIIGMMHKKTLLDVERLQRTGGDFINLARELTVGRYLAGHHADRVYNPIGYEISAKRAEEDRQSGATGRALQQTAKSMTEAAGKRITGA